MALRLTAAEAQRLGLRDPQTPRQLPSRRRPSGYPPDTDNGHVWHRERRGYRCQACQIWIPPHWLPMFGHGAWREVLEELYA